MNITADTHQQLTNDLSAIMAFVDQLRQIDTTHIIPLAHPLNLHQNLRQDEVQSDNCVDQLKAIAPLFIDQLYMVPKVIPTET